MITHEVKLNNSEILETMEGFRKEFYRLRDLYGTEDGISKSGGLNLRYSNEYFCNWTYLQEMMSDPDSHIGYPTEYYSTNLPQLKRKHPDQWGKYLDDLKNRTAERFGAHTSALALHYPPEGFVGWHTNWNSPSYQILFTWSETGDGYFRYKDPTSNTIVTLRDSPGWNVRYHYFGRKEEPEHALWHCAYTKCERFSFAYKYVNDGYGSNQDAFVREIFEDTIHEIETR